MSVSSLPIENLRKFFNTYLPPSYFEEQVLDIISLDSDSSNESKNEFMVLTSNHDQSEFDDGILENVEFLVINNDSPLILDNNVFVDVKFVVIVDNALTNLDLTSKRVLHLYTESYFTSMVMSHLLTQNLLMIHTNDDSFTNLIATPSVLKKVRFLGLKTTKENLTIRYNDNFKKIKLLSIFIGSKINLHICGFPNLDNLVLSSNEEFFTVQVKITKTRIKVLDQLCEGFINISMDKETWVKKLNQVQL